MGYFARVARKAVGNPIDLPDTLGCAWPELRALRYRRGGIPLRVGGWMLGQKTVAAITLGRTIFLAPGTRLEEELLLHELRHVQQFAERRTFPIRYLWESLRCGYFANRYETDARDYAARRLAGITGTNREEEA